MSSTPPARPGWTPTTPTDCAAKHRDPARTTPRERRRASSQRVVLRFLRSPLEILGDGDGRVAGVRVVAQPDRATPMAACRRPDRGGGGHRLRPRAALDRLPRRAAPRRPVRRAPRPHPQRRRPRTATPRRAAARRVRGRLDQARPERRASEPTRSAPAAPSRGSSRIATPAAWRRQPLPAATTSRRGCARASHGWSPGTGRPPSTPMRPRPQTRTGAPGVKLVRVPEHARHRRVAPVSATPAKLRGARPARSTPIEGPAAVARAWARLPVDVDERGWTMMGRAADPAGRLERAPGAYDLTFPRYEALMLLFYNGAASCRWGRSATGCRSTGRASRT